MHKNEENPVISPEIPYLDVIEAISKGKLGAVSVVDQDGKLLGIITDGDIRRSLKTINPQDWETLTSSTVMTPSPITITPDVLAYDALKLMENRPSQISVLPVVDHKQTSVGMLRLHDIVRSGLA